MIRLLIILFFININLFANVHFTSEEKEFMKNHPVIKVANEMDWPPFDYNVDGKAKGMSIDYIKLLFSKTSMKIEFVNGYSWYELVGLFKQKKIDILPAFYYSKDRELYANFTTPYYQVKMGLFSQKDNESIKSWDDLPGKTIGIQKEVVVTSNLHKRFIKSKFIEFATNEELFKALATKKIDAAINNPLVFHFNAKKFQTTNIQLIDYLKISKFQQEKISLHVGVRKDWVTLYSILQKIIYKISKEELSRIEEMLTDKNDFIKVNGKEASVYFTFEEREYLKNRSAIKMCVDPDWMPYEMIKGSKHVGIAADYFDIVRKYISTPINLLETSSWNQTLKYAKEKKCDIISLIAPTLKREEYLNFTNAYLDVPLVLATRIDVPFITNFKRLKNKKIGIIKDYSYVDYFKQTYPNLEIVEVENTLEGLQRVVDGELFGYIGAITSIGYKFQDRFVGQLKVAGRFDRKVKLAIAVQNDDKMLYSIFQKIVNNISNGQTQKILNKYVAINYEKGFDYTLFYKILGGVVLFFLAFLYRQYMLHKLNASLKQIVDQKTKELKELNKNLEEKVKDRTKELELSQKKLLEQANRDPLTNLYNRRFFSDISIEILNLAKRDETDLSIAMIDIDKFKNINDTYGHKVGDMVIKSLSEIFNNHIRKSDVTARIGGEEFALLLPETSKVGAYAMAQKIKNFVENQEIVLQNGAKVKFTVCIGVDSVDIKNDADVFEALDRADKALYIAKRKGRNLVIMTEDKEEL